MLLMLKNFARAPYREARWKALPVLHVDALERSAYQIVCFGFLALNQRPRWASHIAILLIPGDSKKVRSAVGGFP